MYFNIEPQKSETREDKIAAYKASKRIQEEIRVIEQGKGMEAWEGDDEMMRAYCKLALESHAQTCFENIRFCEMEKKMIEQGTGVVMTESVDSAKTRRRVYSGPLLDKSGKVCIYILYCK